MIISVFSRTYEYSDLDETFSRLKNHGIAHTQLNFSNAGLPTLPEAVTDKDIDRILAAKDRYGLTFDALTGTFNMIDPDADARANGCRQFKVQCEAAAALGIPLVTLCTGSRSPKGKWTWDDSNLSEESWSDLLRSTEEILRYAEDNKIILGVETEASNVINTPERARKYLDCFASPNLKIVMDGANLFLPEQVPMMNKVLEDAFAILGKDIVSAHAKDLTLKKGISFVAAGSGELNFEYYILLLKKYGYDGPLIMHGLSEEQVPTSKSYLERLM